jgi:SnoaL-like domain
MRSAGALAGKFAAALDAEDYATLSGLLAADCRYESPKGRLTGPGAIIASYEKAGASAKVRFDSVSYESSVRIVAEGAAIVTFLDHLEHGELKHTYSCQQMLSVNADGLICQIVHVELPGERVALEKFRGQVDIARDQK